MDELLKVIFGPFEFWGAWLGLGVAALLTWALSSMFWGEFNVEMFVGFGIPCLVGGVYLQHLVAKN